MNRYAYAAFTNLGICIAIATGVSVSGSAWALLGLFFIQIPKAVIKTKLRANQLRE
ncbi:hypothetical protein [Brevibacillus porteri]|uniref:hypothetical protein n=1 Tax=Brevibacillus porteri TaxID=2126350 RepID=UPI003D1A2640